MLRTIVSRVAAFAVVAGLTGPHDGLAAPGTNFAWNACLPEGGVSLKTWACNANYFPRWNPGLAIASFRTAQAIPGFNWMEAWVEVLAAGPTLPSWWEFRNAGSCRATSLAPSSFYLDYPSEACQDPWQGMAAGGMLFYQTGSSMPPWEHPNGALLKVVFGLPDPLPLEADVEYFGFALRLDARKTVGADSCAGCDAAVCLVLRQIRVGVYGGSSEVLATPLIGSAISWQCATPSTGLGSDPDGHPTYELEACAATSCATPARNATWGAIKSLYR